MFKSLLFTLILSINTYALEQRVCSDIKLSTITGKGEYPEQLNEMISSVNISYIEDYKVQISDKNGSIVRSYSNCYHSKRTGSVKVECYPSDITPEEAEGHYDLSSDQYTINPTYPLIQILLIFNSDNTTLIGFNEFSVFSKSKCVNQ